MHPCKAVSSCTSHPLYETCPFLVCCLQAVSKGPVVIYFEVDNDFFSYSGGVYQPSGCGSAVNHAMVSLCSSTHTHIHIHAHVRFYAYSSQVSACARTHTHQASNQSTEKQCMASLTSVHTACLVRVYRWLLATTTLVTLHPHTGSSVTAGAAGERYILMLMWHTHTRTIL